MSSWSSPVASNGIDPVTLEVVWNRLLSVANEQQDALIRTAFSTIVRESQDLACGVFDTKGRMIAQSITGTPGHINAMASSMRHFLAAYPPAKLAPGDVLITNDPWMTAGQINDITITSPIFKNGRLVALFANTCHAACACRSPTTSSGKRTLARMSFNKTSFGAPPSKSFMIGSLRPSSKTSRASAERMRPPMSAAWQVDRKSGTSLPFLKIGEEIVMSLI